MNERLGVYFVRIDVPDQPNTFWLWQDREGRWSGTPSRGLAHNFQEERRALDAANAFVESRRDGHWPFTATVECYPLAREVKAGEGGERRER